MSDQKSTDIWIKFYKDRQRPRAGEIWQHYSGKRVRITGMCLLEASLDPQILYHETEGVGIWARPFSDWYTPVLQGQTTVPRFVKVSDA
jgi:hypothetical protein